MDWTEGTLPTGTTVAIGARTAASSGALSSASWTSLTDATSGCTLTSGSVVCPSAALPSSFKSNSEWWQYMITETSTGLTTPTVSSVSVKYVKNAPPTFNGAATAVQDATPADANFGKVNIAYSVEDTDTSSGTTNPGYISPSFQYSINGGSTWTAIPSGDLGATDQNLKAVSQSSFTPYTATWNAKSTIPGTAISNAEVKVIANDNEAANNTGSSATANFTLDTKPATGTLTLNVGAGTVTLNATDNSNLSYVIENGTTANGAMTSVGTTTINTTPAWTFGSETNKTVSALVTDAYGNSVTFTAIAPAIPQSFQARDLTNLPAGVYGEALSWTTVSNITGATTASYQIWKQTNSSAYVLLTTISQNSYLDYAVSAGNVYNYKVLTVDTDGDSSNFSNPQSITPSGSVITNVVAGTPTSSGVVITWTTSTLANSVVDYGTSTSYGTLQTGTDGNTTSHTVTLTGLTP